VKTYLRDTLHVDISKLPDDVIGTKFTATTKSRKGDDFDGVLDDLKIKLGTRKLEEAENEIEHGEGRTNQNTSAFATSTGQKADAVAGQSLYTASCSGCHGAGMPAAVNYQRTLSAIAGNKGGMGPLSATINTAAADNIATYLAFGATPVALTAQSITFTSPGNQTMGAAPSLAASSTSGLGVTLASTTPTICTVTNTALTLMSPGTCTLTASQNGNASFAAAAVVTQTFAVAAASGPVLTAQTISFTAPADQTMGMATPALVATSTSGLIVTLASATPSICTVSGTTLTLVAAGSCTVTASQSGSSTVAAAATASNTFLVAPALMGGVAATGQLLYQGLCSGCHGVTPGVNLSRNILKAANTPSVISNAITKNLGNMGYLANPGYSTQQLADMAAYLATPGL
jgi:mono/diheme cytochrome c family protein